MTAPPLGPDPEFALMLEQLAHAAVRERDYEMAGYLMDAAEMWEEPTEVTRTLRLQVLTAAIANEARERAA